MKAPMEKAVSNLEYSLKIAEGFENKIKSEYFKQYLSIARSIISFWNNPPKGKNFFASYTIDEIARVRWNLENSMKVDV